MDVRSILFERGIRPTRSLGQYFLVDDDVAARMVEYAGLELGEVVLEIGAGVGSLTEKLNQRAKKVYAVEKDSGLCALLQECYERENSNTEVIECDIMKFELPEFDKVVASIPFLLSSPITYKLLLREAGFGLAVLLYQKEFAQKLVATPGSKLYGRLSVISQALAEVEIMKIVRRDAFFPPAPVKGAIVRLRDKETQIGDKQAFFEFVTVAFDQRRKKMRTIFKKTRLGCLTLAAMDKRPEELRPEEFVKLVEYF
ncbi:MAG: ribosomal RNA small subunit methyltransferase A [Methanomicrobia archaeon]|nr:ribosomal RNA small subunit methyltransferase A [Methanomicrobia archaeon]